MKDMANLESELSELLSQYCDSEKVQKRADNWIDEHDFLAILNDCEELVKKINEVKE